MLPSHKCHCFSKDDSPLTTFYRSGSHRNRTGDGTVSYCVIILRIIIKIGKLWTFYIKTENRTPSSKTFPFGEGGPLAVDEEKPSLGRRWHEVPDEGFRAVTSSDLAWHSLRSATFPRGEGFFVGRYCVLILKYAAKSCEKTGNYEHFKSGQSTVPCLTTNILSQDRVPSSVLCLIVIAQL